MAEEQKRDKYLIFHSENGLGKQIMATAVVSGLKKKHPDYKIIVVTPWDAPFYNHPDVWRVYTIGALQYFYENYIFDDTLIYRHNPYHTADYVRHRKHLIEIWFDLYGIPHEGEKPFIKPNPQEIEIVRQRLGNNDKRPIFLLQTNGGAEGQNQPTSWVRDMPLNIAQQVIQFYQQNYRVLHIRREDQPALPNIEHVNLPHRELFALFALSSKRLFIDSFAQHAAAAMNLKSTVYWIGNHPKTLGYKLHDNLLPEVEPVRQFNKFKYTDDYDITGNPSEYPYDVPSDQLIKVQTIIKSLGD